MLLFSLVLVIENAVLLNIVPFEVEDETVIKLLVLLTDYFSFAKINLIPLHESDIIH